MDDVKFFHRHEDGNGKIQKVLSQISFRLVLVMYERDFGVFIEFLCFNLFVCKRDYEKLLPCWNM